MYLFELIHPESCETGFGKSWTVPISDMLTSVHELGHGVDSDQAIARSVPQHFRPALKPFPSSVLCPRMSVA